MRLCLLLAGVLSATFLSAQINARLFQHPDVSDTHITFAYGGDVWVVPKSGGTATKLSSPKGNESFPRFSPDGSQIAFSGNYDGNTDIYVLPSMGGIPQRVTHHGMSDRLLGWFPDGKHLLYVSAMESGKQRFSQFYKIPATGGLPEKLPMAYGEFGSVSPDGQKIAFTDRSRILRTWKRYRGGMAADVWLFDLKTMESENITDNAANDELPMWVGDKVYFLSDQGPNQRFNIWMYDTRSKSSKQLTNFSEFDVHFPADGPKEIVFEAGGKLQLLDLATEAVREVDIQVVSDLITVKPRKESVEDYVQNMAIAPDGNRAIVEARGEIFSLPKEEGIIQNLTRTSGVAERFPAWSPNGRYIAYWSDKSGEYELTVRDMSKGAQEKQLTNLGPGYRYQLYWSPDSKKLAFVDQTMHINVYNMATNSIRQIDQDLSLFEGGLRGWTPSWSADSKWLAYSKSQDNNNGAIMIYDTEADKLTQATSGFYSDVNPTFDREGDYLFLLTNRSFRPVYSDFDNSWTYPNATQLAAIPLRDEVTSPLAAKNDTVAIQLETEEEKKDDKDDKKDDEEISVGIDFDNFERRLVILPPSAGNMGNLSAAKGKIVFQRYPNTGTSGEDNALMYFDLKEKEEKTIMKKVNGYELSADGKKLLVRQGNNSGIIDLGADKKLEDNLSLKKMEMTVNPREEWAQIFNDAWRFQRDFFYDKKMHGVDWPAMRKQYGDMIQYAITRNDVNFILGELIGELNASHTYRGGGDQESPDRKAVGYLGVDWAKENGQFKVKEIIRGAEWDNEVRSPLDEPGVNIKAGDYILAVNGMALADYPDPWAAFEGLSNETVELTVSKSPNWDDTRQVVVKTIPDETRLRNLAWIEQNRKRVEEASNGQLGYIYVPSTGVDGQNELVRQFYGQWDKPGLIVDERFNNGGQIPDRFIELLNRKPLAYWSVRDGKNWQWPPVGNFGSMAMLINGWAGSGGDAFPDYFKKAGLGPLIGDRTWGGLIGISGAPTLIDGGTVTVPTFRMYNPDGTWFKEGHGVDPDIKVKEDPTKLAKGIDPQLEQAIAEVMKMVKEKGPIHPEEPKQEDRSRVIKP
ncbi:S41 family peptidase [Flavilitoribacter nigricans]|uniref:Tricorn protease homolog n=1 Tax=Flavilitoribacter nigricans (strain ATCC 23147 / DSM 23189 / NBRC 102662 / NCIMB 1420 / SS-2) TaxID=1122177 RepID=A0A2D0NB42_FLAN2|nr:S41 family peptidase [Flavilitoribacter nigricans]PHN05598.1 peptidase S41 [Flavilitoribacter nigricans DSM 23189 = NBRC 102662]